ncbi:MAG: DUF4652 domain-containing protein [Desulfovibrionales bacterium]
MDAAKYHVFKNMKAFFFFLIFWLFLTGCSGPGQDEERVNEEDSGEQPGEVSEIVPDEKKAGPVFLEGETFFYRSEGVPAPVLRVQVHGKEKVITHENGGLSKPKVSPGGKRLAFVMPTGFEVPGEVHIMDADLSVRTAVPVRDMPDNHCAKKIAWYDNRYLAVIVGFTFGTVTVGGDVFFFDTEEDRLFPIYTEQSSSREVMDILVENGAIHMQIAVFNSDYTEYTIEEKVLSAEDVFAQISEQQNSTEVSLEDSQD